VRLDDLPELFCAEINAADNHSCFRCRAWASWSWACSSISSTSLSTRPSIGN